MTTYEVVVYASRLHKERRLAHKRVQQPEAVSKQAVVGRLRVDVAQNDALGVRQSKEDRLRILDRLVHRQRRHRRARVGRDLIEGGGVLLPYGLTRKSLDLVPKLRRPI